MSFFKKLFSSNKGGDNKQDQPEFKGVIRTDAFRERYTEDPVDPKLLDGCLKMVESYYLEYPEIKKKVTKIPNHPANLDQVVHEGIGFHPYCQLFKLEDSQTVAFLAFSFADFLVKHYGFIVYKDHTPEYPLRTMTLKYNKDGVVLSLYPYEFANKVLNGESKFEDLYAKIGSNLQTLPGVDEILNNL
jgi:hypothetical protein